MIEQRKEHMGRLEDLPEPPEIGPVSREHFDAQVLSRYCPVVMRGFARQWPLVEAGLEHPDKILTCLRQFAASKTAALIELPAREAGRMFYNASHDGLNFSRSSVALGEGLERMQAAREKDSPCYAFQALGIREYFPDLEGQLDNPLSAPHREPFIWIGNRITVAPHFDELNNIAVVAAGRRRFTFFPPDQVANLYVGRIDFTPAGQAISLVDLRNPDDERFPRYAEAYRKALSVELAAGDAVYIPSPWWHHVESLDPLNVLVNFWWSGLIVPSALGFPLLIHAIIALKTLPAEQRQAWKRLLEHYVFEENGDPGAHLPAHARGVLGTLTPDMLRHLHRWLTGRLQ